MTCPLHNKPTTTSIILTPVLSLTKTKLLRLVFSVEQRLLVSFDIRFNPDLPLVSNNPNMSPVEPKSTTNLSSKAPVSPSFPLSFLCGELLMTHSF